MLREHYNKIVDGETTTVKKYYTAGTQTISVRTIAGGNNTLNWILSDYLGSTNMTTNADGSFNSEIQYTAFGEVWAASGVTPTGYKYTGQLEQAELGLDYFVARWYDPALAHFTQADTVVPEPGNAMTYDRYGYARYNPIKFNDPSGHDVGCAGHEASHCGQGWNKPYFRPHFTNRPFGWEGDYENPGSGYEIWNRSEGITLFTPKTGEGYFWGRVIGGIAKDLTGGLISQDNGKIKIGYEPWHRSEKDVNIGIIFAVPESGINLSSSGIVRMETKGGVYSLINKENNNVMYIGRTSNFVQREYQHSRDLVKSEFRFDIVYRTDDYATQRGLVQLLYDEFLPPLNNIRPISSKNPKIELYIDLAKLFLTKR
jgi:RHS repeat-associated protein